MIISLSKTQQVQGGNIGASSVEKPAAILRYTIFYGGDNNPFLAPRGVFAINNRLFVSDTGQNRVFIFNTIPQTPFQQPDVVLGQSEAAHTMRNNGVAVSAATLQYPSGIWSDGQKLIVADAWNHRILIWNTIPTQNGQPADVVIGQPDFNSNQPNVKGIGTEPSDNSLNWPYGVFSDGNSLWIADTGNRRILFYETIPTVNFAAADKLVGKTDFNDRDYDDNQPVWPYSVKISPQGEMIVADTQFYRVLVWKNWQKAFQGQADCIIGQPDFQSCGQNQFGLSANANTLNWVYDACFFKKGILVADTGNSRILRFENIPTENNLPAENVIGQYNFSSGSENSETRHGTDKQLYWPFSVCVAENNLIVADTGNHRLLIYELSPDF